MVTESTVAKFPKFFKTGPEDSYNEEEEPEINCLEDPRRKKLVVKSPEFVNTDPEDSGTEDLW